jgi:hypothetical protein
MKNSKGKNLIDVIDLQLKQLEREKDEIENLYGIDENILKEYINKPDTGTKKTTQKQPSLAFTNLPKLEGNAIDKKPKKGDSSKVYKTPDQLVDSLKYEPNIKDLLYEDEFEPTFKNLNNLKTTPSITPGYNISDYIKFLNNDFNKKYIN